VNEINQVKGASTTEASAQGEYLQAECNPMEHSLIAVSSIVTCNENKKR
jgi:hypothetical protein